MKKRAKTKRTGKPAELKGSERGLANLKPFKPGQSGNPGGVSKEKRAFLDRLKGEDADTVYEALMQLVRERNPQAVLRAWEYVVGKPKELVEVTGKDGAPLSVQTIDVRKLSAQQLEAFTAALKAVRPDETL